MNNLNDLNLLSPKFLPLRSFDKLHFINLNMPPSLSNIPNTPSSDENKKDSSESFSFHGTDGLFDEEEIFNLMGEKLEINNFDKFFYPEKNNDDTQKEVIYPKDNSSTNAQTNTNQGGDQKLKRQIFQVISRKDVESDYGEKRELRLDYAIKNFKLACVKYIKNYAEKLIKKCHFDIKLFKPSYKFFTGNSNITDIKKFLELTIEEIFTYAKGQKNNLQEKNMNYIKDIKSNIQKEKIKNGDCYDKLGQFLNMTFRDAVKQFYDSEEFLKFSCTPKALSLDQVVMQVKNTSLLEKNGFLNL